MDVQCNVSIVIPSLNPDEKLRKTVQDLVNLGFTDIILINDGSKRECVSNFPTDVPGCTLLTHEVNQGKGAAMKTAFRYLLERNIPTQGVVTVDGDGQHKATDVLACARAMQETRGVVLGVRDFDLPDVPPRSRMGNKITSLVFRLFCGIKISDTQTGLRAIPLEYLPAMLEVSGDRYEYETNMLLQMKARQIPCSEVPIETVYIEENQTSHFRPVRDSLRIYGLILKFISSSLIASVVDLGIFFLLSLFMPSMIGVASDAVCTLIARIGSSIVNYSINKKAVFRSSGSGRTSLPRYYILAAGIFILSASAMTVLTLLFGFDEGRFAFLKTVFKFIIDSVLFLISFRVQREWVFADTENT